jgi:hypothetical protein
MNTAISIVLFLIILVSLYQMYYYLNPQLLNEGTLISLKQTPMMDISVDKFEDPSGVRYFYDGWLYIDKINSDQTIYNIFNRGKDFIVALKGHSLSIMNYTAIVPTDTGVVDNNSNTLINITTNLPFQKWTYFCINVDLNRVDVYLDGKLTKSIPNAKIKSDNDKPLSDVVKTDPIKIGNSSVVGSLARFRREPSNMDPQSVWSAYMLGPGAYLPGDDINADYHARISLLRNNKIKRTVNLF